LKSNLIENAKVQQVGIMQLQLNLIKFAKFPKIAIEELPLDLICRNARLT
jgi:hypothetical protein